MMKRKMTVVMMMIPMNSKCKSIIVGVSNVFNGCLDYFENAWISIYYFFFKSFEKREIVFKLKYRITTSKL